MTPAPTPEAAELAGKLTAADRVAFRELSGKWQAGPYLTDALIDRLAGFRADGLVERQFGDLGEPETRANADGFSASLHACWFLRLTTLGAQVAALLLKDKSHG